MKIEKKVIGTLSKCYCLAPLHYNNEDFILVAAEKQDPCYLFNLEGERVDTVWEEPGGVMTMVQVPGSNGQFLATHKFYSPNDSREAKIVVCTPEDGQWKINTLVELPFVHRFDILESEGKKYLIACALKSGHEYKNDWTHPGKIFVAELPENLREYSEEHQLELKVLMDGLTKNHGYTRCQAGSDAAGADKQCSDAAGADKQCSDVAGACVSACVVSTDNGVFKITPPGNESGWQVECLTQDSASDAALVDLKGDGEEELCVLAPFHGPEIKIYEKKDGTYQCAYRYDRPAEFTHAIYGGPFGRKNAFIAGHREGAMELLIFTWEAGQNMEPSQNMEASQSGEPGQNGEPSQSGEAGKGGYKYQVIDSGRGPANVLRVQPAAIEPGPDGKNAEILVAANRETDEIAIYKITEI